MKGKSMTTRTITTTHTEIGYSKNIEIIAKALREDFGLNDASHVLTAVAAHIWSGICGRYNDERKWGTAEIIAALDTVAARVQKMRDAIQ